MKRVTIIVSLLAMLIINTSVQANGKYTGQIASVWVNDGARNNVGWIKVKDTLATPSCSDSKYFALDLSQADKKVALTFALSAHMAGRQVAIGGTGVCLEQKYEYLKFIEVQ